MAGLLALGGSFGPLVKPSPRLDNERLSRAPGCTYVNETSKFAHSLTWIARFTSPACVRVPAMSSVQVGAGSVSPRVDL